MDAKGRIVLPARLKARLPDTLDQRIVILLGFQKCLTIYTMTEWEEKLKTFAEVSEYDEEGQRFIRNFTYGMTEETLDGQGRFSLNKTLINYAGLLGMWCLPVLETASKSGVPLNTRKYSRQ